MSPITNGTWKGLKAELMGWWPSIILQIVISHTGEKDPRFLFEPLADLKLPLIRAGGMDNESDFIKATTLEYSGIQMGTRLIATFECKASPTYKNAIVKATKQDIVFSERITGVPISVILTLLRKTHRAKTGPNFPRAFSKTITKAFPPEHLSV